MVRIVHRRLAPRSKAAPMGPGSTIGPLLARLVAPLTWVGRLSLLAGAASMLWMAWSFPMQAGDVPADALAQAVAHDLGSLALILLPAALELGYPGVARRNRVLLGGVALLAAAEVVGLLLNGAERWLTVVFTAATGEIDNGPLGVDPTTGMMLALSWFSIARLIAAVGGWVRVSQGLRLAGAGVDRHVLIAVTVITGAIQLVVTVLYSGSFNQDVSPLVLATNVVAAAVGVAVTAAIAVVVAVLAAGAAGRVAPLVAWRLGAAAAVALAIGIGAPWGFVLLWSIRQDLSDQLLLVAGLDLGGVVAPLLLVAACLAGLGRGKMERLPRHSRRPTFVVSGPQRLLVGRSPQVRAAPPIRPW